MAVRTLPASSPEQRDIDYVEPAKNAVDDRPQDRMVVGVGDRDGERRAKTHAVFRALDANPVVSISVHGDPFEPCKADKRCYGVEARVNAGGKSRQRAEVPGR